MMYVGIRVFIPWMAALVSIVSAMPCASFATVFDVAGAIRRSPNSPSWRRPARKGELAFFSTQTLPMYSPRSSLIL